MKKTTDKMLKLLANLSKKVAVKSCGATSVYDLYQPKVPDAVKSLAHKNAN